MDVLPVYPSSESKDELWLFYVLHKTKNQFFGRWLTKTETENKYVLVASDKINFKWVMRINHKLQNFFVLPKFKNNQHFYILSSSDACFLSREYKCFLAGLT